MGEIRALCLRLFAADTGASLGQPVDESLYDEALDRAEELLAAPAGRLLGFALTALGQHERWTDPDLADRCFDRALAVSRETGDPSDIAWTAVRGRVEASRSWPTREGLSVCAAALEDCRAVQDYVFVETMRGDILAQSGQLRAGAEQLRRAAHRLPDPQLAPDLWTYPALLEVHWRIALGDWTRAAALLEACQRLQLEDWMVGTQVATEAANFAAGAETRTRPQRLAEWAHERLGPEPGAVSGRRP